MKSFKTLRDIDPSRFKSVTQWIWALIAIMGIAVLCVGGLRTWRMVQCGNWPTTSGEVVTSDVKRGLVREGSMKHQYSLKYRYTIKGTEYQSERISFTGNPLGSRSIRELLAVYRPGKEITVHHHPKHPELAVVEAVFSWKGFKLPVFGLVLACLGITGVRYRWPLQTDYLFTERDPDKPLTTLHIVFGTLGLLSCLAIVWIWWELIKMYAGR